MGRLGQEVLCTFAMVEAMITEGEGSIFDSNADAIVNAVNCVGIMGGGLAKAFKDRFPHMYEQYVLQCAYNVLRPGKMDLYFLDPQNHKFIINFPTKDHFKDPSELRYILDGTTTLASVVKRYKMRSVALPALGCGLGGLSWGVVKPILQRMDILVPEVEWIIYDPQ